MAEVLGTFEQAVLLAVVRLGANAYGRAILNDVQSRLQRDVTAGAVYATLDRLELKGLLSSHLGSGTPVRAGRPRRYYLVENAGVEALNNAKAAVEKMWRGFRAPLKGRA
jgi:PadR family transcriptional regulator PadR